MGNVLDTVRNAWKIPELKRKIIITILLLIVYRIGTYIPVPSLDAARFSEMIKSNGNSIFGFVDILSGGAFAKLSIFAMSITPYINASIIMQLLTVAIPKLEQLAKEGEEGRKKIGQYIRYGTVVLGFFQAAGLYVGLGGAVKERGVLAFFIVTLSFTAGTAFLMWLGEQITEYGVGNGISLIIFASIVSSAPQGVQRIMTIFMQNESDSKILGVAKIIGILVIFIIVVATVIWVQQAERRIPVQYAKKVVGRKMYGGQNTHIPIKVNLAGVIPIIFAMSFVALPSTLIGFFAPDSTNPVVSFFKNIYGSNNLWFPVLTGVLVMIFTFFYTFIQFNPIEIANNMKKSGGFIPGIRPGRPTSEYIMKVLKRVTWFAALFLAVIQIFPSIIGLITKLDGVWMGGTSVLILVGVALDTVKQVESQMLVRHYKGFLE